MPPWELTDAIDRGDTAVALDRLHRMIGGGDRHPLQIMATLHGHYARMLRLDGAGVGDEKDAAEVLGHEGLDVPGPQGARPGRAARVRWDPAGDRVCWPTPTSTCGARRPGPSELVMEVLVARLSPAWHAVAPLTAGSVGRLG